MLPALLLAGCSGAEPPLEGVRLEVPNEVRLEAVSPGTTALAPLAIRNPSATEVRIVGISPSEGFTTDAYAFGVELEPLRLAPRETIVTRVSFSPRVALMEPVSAAFTILTDALPSEVTLFGRTPSPALLFEPPAVDFGVIPLGGSSDRPVTITNAMPDPVTLTVERDEAGRPYVEQVGGRGRFEVVGEATEDGALLGGRSLLPGESAGIRVRYHRPADPAAPADRGILTVFACEGPECAASVPLFASSERTALTCAPIALDFGAVHPGDRKEGAVDCTNRTGDEIVASARLLEADPGFELADAPPVSLRPDERVRFLVAFAPDDQELGTPRRATIAVRGERPGNRGVFEPVVVPLLGEGSRAAVRVLPARVVFGRVAVGTEVRRTVRIENTGTSLLRAELDAAPPFVRTDGGDVEVPPGGAFAVTLLFEPEDAGPALGELTITTNDPDRPRLSVLMEAEAILLPPCEWRLMPEELNFGLVERPRVGHRRLHFENVGEDICLVKDVAATGEFGVSTELDEALVGAGERLPIHVDFRPSGVGPRSGALRFYVSTSDPVPTIQLAGYGSTSGLVLSPPEVDFGAAQACAETVRHVDVLNAGPSSVEVDRVDLLGDGGFSMLTPAAGFTLGPGERRRLDVRHQGGPGLARLEVRAVGEAAPAGVDLVASAGPVTEERFLMPRSADVLFIIEASPALPQTAVASALPSFVSLADAEDVDWQIGVITTDALENGCPGPPSGMPETSTTTGDCGFLANRGDPAFRLITPATLPSPNAAFLQTAAVGSGASSPPVPFAAAYHALSNPILSAWNQGLVRPNAQLLLVFVTARDDASFGSVEHWLSYYRSLHRETNALTVSALVGDPSDGCTASHPRLTEAASAFGGSLLSGCTPNIAAAMAELGESLAGKKALALEGVPRPETLVLEVDGSPIPAEGAGGVDYWAYDAATNTIGMSPLVRPGPGGELVVRYAPECF